MLKRNYADNSLLPDYDTFRADTFHQFTLPKTFGGWLSVVPRIGARLTYYGDTGFYQNQLNPSTGVEESVLHLGGSATRAAFNTGPCPHSPA